MSQANVEIVRRAVDAFNRHDVGALAALSHDELQFVSVLSAMDAEAAIYTGAEAWTTYFARMNEIWDDWRVEDVEVSTPAMIASLPCSRSRARARPAASR